MNLNRSLIYRGLIRRALFPLNSFLHWIECQNPPVSGPLPYPPVFIVGAPRSGSTVLFQLMLRRFEFSYLTNLHDKFYGAPSIIERLYSSCLRNTAALELRSKHGVTSGMNGPSEAGNFWYRFFRFDPPYVSANEVDPRKMNILRKSLAAFGNVTRRPTLFKNLYCSFRISPLVQWVPEARFLVIRRNLSDQAHSILETRRTVHGNYDTWWSMEPPEIREIQGLPPGAQAVAQIRAIHAIIDRDLCGCGGRYLEVDYERMCDAPNETMSDIERFLRREGVFVRNRDAEISPLERRSKLRIAPSVYQQALDQIRGSDSSAAA